MGIVRRLNSLFHYRQNSILSASIVLAVTFGLSALLGLLRSKFLYAHFFACCVLDLDAYNAAFRIPDLIFKLLVTGALSASFIPVFSSYLHKDEQQAFKIASTVINLLLIAFAVLSLIVFIFTPFFSSVVAGGFTPSQIVLMSELTRILLFAQIFFLVSNFITGILQVNQIFLIPSISPLLYNLAIIASIIFLAPKYGIYGVTYGAVIGAFLHLAIQLPSLKRVGFKYFPLVNINLSGVREIIRLMIPRSLSLGLGEIENTVTLFFASTLMAGSISLLNLAMQVMYLPSRIFATTVGQASLPALSKNIAKNELDIFRNTVRSIILQSLYIALPVTILILIHRVAIVRLAFGAKQFPWEATLQTAKTLAFLTPAIASQAIIQILIRSFYALHNTKTPLKISAISLVLNITTAYLFVNFTNLGIYGLAISASIGNLVQCFGLLYFFIKIVDGNGWQKTRDDALRIFISSIFMGLTTWLSLKVLDLFVLDTSKTLSLAFLFTVSSCVGLISYVYISQKFKLEQIKSYQRFYLKLANLFQKH
jgi:putative peptidoglycan lipid II flippase